MATRRSGTNGNFVVVATWITLVIALIGAGFALYGLYGPHSRFKSQEEEFAKLQSDVTTLQATVGGHGTSIDTLQTKAASAEAFMGSQAPLESYQASVGNTVEMQFENTGMWGGWSKPLFCASGHYVCGLSQRVESNQRRGDDTAMNGMKFYCCPFSK